MVACKKYVHIHFMASNNSNNGLAIVCVLDAAGATVGGCQEGDVHIMHNDSSLCTGWSWRPGAFAQRVFERVLGLLHQGRMVLLMGHSYGGAVVSRVAELLHKHALVGGCSAATLARLKCATFGATYVPAQPTTTVLVPHMVHYMYADDVALRSNPHLQPPPRGGGMDESARVVWLPANQQQQQNYYYQDYQEALVKACRRRTETLHVRQDENNY